MHPNQTSAFYLVNVKGLPGFPSWTSTATCRGKRRFAGTVPTSAEARSNPSPRHFPWRERNETRKEAHYWRIPACRAHHCNAVITMHEKGKKRAKCFFEAYSSEDQLSKRLILNRDLVGASGFEPPTSWSRTRMSAVQNLLGRLAKAVPHWRTYPRRHRGDTVSLGRTRRVLVDRDDYRRRGAPDIYYG